MDQPLYRAALTAVRGGRGRGLPAPKTRRRCLADQTSGSGMGIVDFTNPGAREWYSGKLRALLDLGVDCFKTDFGERIPTDVVWSDGADPERMHNYYSYLYNQTVFELLRSIAVSRRRWSSPDLRRPAGSASPSTGAGTASRRSSRWPRACAVGCPWPCPVSGSGVTTSAASKDVRTRRCSSDGFLWPAVHS